MGRFLVQRLLEFCGSGKIFNVGDWCCNKRFNGLPTYKAIVTACLFRGELGKKCQKSMNRVCVNNKLG